MELDAGTLFLVPTTLEREQLKPFWTQRLSVPLPQTVGFGPIAAGVGTMLRLQQAPQPVRQVCLVGVAGAFDETVGLPGSAREFTSVRCDGVGVGEGPEFQSAESLGWNPWQDLSSDTHDAIPLDAPGSVAPAELLTVTAASANPSHAARRRACYPEAIAEDMESYAVAMACRLAGVDCRIIRGISNRVGDRNHSAWKISEALESVVQILAGCQTLTADG